MKPAMKPVLLTHVVMTSCTLTFYREARVPQASWKLITVQGGSFHGMCAKVRIVRGPHAPAHPQLSYR